MANPIVGTVVTEVTETIGVIASATVLIGNFKAMQDAAVAAALALGATEAELQPFYELISVLDENTNALAAAVAANQPAPPVEPPV